MTTTSVQDQVEELLSGATESWSDSLQDVPLQFDPSCALQARFFEVLPCLDFACS
jgi:hypothetical protein